MLEDGNSLLVVGEAESFSLHPVQQDRNKATSPPEEDRTCCNWHSGARLFDQSNVLQLLLNAVLTMITKAQCEQRSWQPEMGMSL